MVLTYFICCIQRNAPECPRRRCFPEFADHITVYLKPFVPPSTTNTASMVCACVSIRVEHSSSTKQHIKAHYKAPFSIIALLYLYLLFCSPHFPPSSLFPFSPTVISTFVIVHLLLTIACTNFSSSTVFSAVSYPFLSFLIQFHLIFHCFQQDFPPLSLHHLASHTNIFFPVI